MNGYMPAGGLLGRNACSVHAMPAREGPLQRVASQPLGPAMRSCVHGSSEQPDPRYAVLRIDRERVEADDPRHGREVAPGGGHDGGALDGRRFDGIVLECGKTAGDADTLIFEGGRFRSTACDRYDYGDGAYTASPIGDGSRSSAETRKPEVRHAALARRGARPAAGRHADDDARRRGGRREVDPGRPGGVSAMARIAIIQRAPVFLDRAATLARRWPRWTRPHAPARAGRLSRGLRARLSGVDLAAAAGPDMALTEQLHALCAAQRSTWPRDDLAPLRQAAQQHGVTVVCGVHERDTASRGTLYNTWSSSGPTARCSTAIAS